MTIANTNPPTAGPVGEMTKAEVTEQQLSEWMPNRMSAERLAEIRKIGGSWSTMVADLLAELDAVTRERDAIHSALGVIGVKDADLVGTIANLARERDTAHRRVLQFTGTPTVDEAFAILIAPVEWDALASYHGVTIIGNTPTPAQVERAAEALRKADPDWFASPDFRRSVAHTVLTALGGDHA